MQQERKEAGEGEPGRALTIEQREEQGKINIQLVPCLTRETEAAVVLLPCSFQAHLTGSREGTPAPSDVIIFYFLIISPPPSSPIFPSLSFAQMISATRPGKFGTFSHSSHQLPPPPPASPRPPRATPEKQQRQPTPKSLFFQKEKKKRRKEKKNQRWDESWREPGGGFSVCASECVRAAVAPSPVPLPRRSLAL